MNPSVLNFRNREDRSGEWSVPPSILINLPFSLAGLRSVLDEMFDYETTDSGKAEIAFFPDTECPEEGFILEVHSNGCSIGYRDYSGALYALRTLQSLRFPDRHSFPCLRIQDVPALPFRGFMMDISRDKVPKAATVRALIDKMSELRMNHLELYVEGFSLEYPSFPGVNEGETPMTIREFEELQEYAAVRGIDLCPNMNSFGHMTAWLKRREYRSLAECPAGFFQYGFHFPSSTLNPLDPRSPELVTRMFDDLLPHSRSPRFNLNGDEPFELGRGKSRKAVRKSGLGTVYVDFISRLLAHLQQAGKQPMMWGDVLLKHPEVIARLPKDLLFLDWGYDYDYDFDAHMRELSRQGVRFVGCPGTSSWCSFASRKRDMLATVGSAVQSAVQHGGEGILLTDWGDFGHLQYLPFTYPGLIYAGSCAWEGKALEENAILSRLASWTSSGSARAILTLAGYSELENQHVYNATMAFAPVMFSDPSPRHPVFLKRWVLTRVLKRYRLTSEAAQNILKLLQNAENELDSPSGDDDEKHLVDSEIRMTINAIGTAVRASLFLTRVRGWNRGLLRTEILAGLDRWIQTHPDLWRSRNKDGGLDRSLSRLQTLKSVIAGMK